MTTCGSAVVSSWWRDDPPSCSPVRKSVYQGISIGPCGLGKVRSEESKDGRIPMCQVSRSVKHDQLDFGHTSWRELVRLLASAPDHTNVERMPALGRRRSPDAVCRGQARSAGKPPPFSPASPGQRSPQSSRSFGQNRRTVSPVSMFSWRRLGSGIEQPICWRLK